MFDLEGEGTAGHAAATRWIMAALSVASWPDEPGAVPGEGPANSLAPLLAGARARGMADALDLLGLAAILIDERGSALHANLRAQLWFGPHIGLSDGRLEVRDEAGAMAMAAALAAALHEEHGAPTGSVMLSRGPDLPPLIMRILPIRDHEEDQFQILKAVVLLEEAGASSAQADRARMAGMN